MRIQGIVIANCLWALACSAPGAANDAERCASELSCPAQQVCYRGFCVEQDGAGQDAAASPSGPLTSAPNSSLEPSAQAGESPSAQPVGGPPSAAPSTTPSGAQTNLGAGSQLSIAADAGAVASAAVGDAAAIALDASIASDASSVERPVASAMPVDASPAPVATATAPTQMPMQSGEQACLTACTLRPKAAACRQCFVGLYGDSPHKLCGPKADPSMSAVCAAFCAVVPAGPLGCGDSHACHGAACGSD